MYVFIYFPRDLFIPYVFATGGAVISAIALKEMVVKVIYNEQNHDHIIMHAYSYVQLQRFSGCL